MLDDRAVGTSEAVELDRLSILYLRCQLGGEAGT